MSYQRVFRISLRHGQRTDMPSLCLAREPRGPFARYSLADPPPRISGISSLYNHYHYHYRGHYHELSIFFSLIMTIKLNSARQTRREPGKTRIKKSYPETTHAQQYFESSSHLNTCRDFANPGNVTCKRSIACTFHLNDISKEESKEPSEGSRFRNIGRAANVHMFTVLYFYFIFFGRSFLGDIDICGA